MLNTAEAAAWLAFSDLGETLSVISVLFLERRFQGQVRSGSSTHFSGDYLKFKIVPQDVTIMKIVRVVTYIVGSSLLEEQVDSTDRTSSH